MKTLSNVLVIIVLALFFSCNNPSQKTSSTIPTKLKIQDNGVNIAYTDSGKGDTTLLFVHGWLINRSYWASQVKYFSKKYRVVTIDLPGYGGSGKNRNSWTVKDFGRDVDSVITELDLKNVILVGHSMAGNIILRAAINAPGKVIGLVGVDNFLGVGYPEDAKSKAAFANAIVELKKNFKQVATQYFSEDLFYKTTADSIKKRVLNDVAHGDPIIAIASMEDNSSDDVAALKATKQKLYLINSDIHKTYTKGFIANNIPFEIKEIHATGHFPMIEKPVEFNTLLAQVIADIKADKK